MVSLYTLRVFPRKLGEYKSDFPPFSFKRWFKEMVP